MLVLLPPSEAKAAAPAGSRAAALDLAGLSFPGLTPTRERVIEAAVAVSRRPDALEVLGAPPTVGADVARTAALRTSPTLAAGRCYTGVLYDALDLATLDSAARRRASRRLVVVSALYGAVRPGDRIAPYRLSMGVDLPGVGPLAAAWRGPLDAELSAAAGRGLVIDCRSAAYVAAWRPTGDLTARWVHVRVPGASHGAKHTRGLLARALCQTAEDPRSPEALTHLLAERTPFALALHPPTGPRQPHVLDVTPPGAPRR